MFPNDLSLDVLNDFGKGNMGEHLGIEFIETGEDYIKAKMPVDHRTHQPLGMLHGGASVVLAETLGSVAATLTLDLTKQYAVGLEINANHIRSIKNDTGVTEEDIAKRLIDFGFHAPTMSWPVPGTMMIEPTESESLQELDRFCDCLIKIKEEIDKIKNGNFDKNDNPIKNAPHTDLELASNKWEHKYSREEAAYPSNFLRSSKFWPPVARVDNVYGDKNLFCTCPSMDEFKEDAA